MKPLDGMVVLDFTHAAAGPLCTMLLADFGAKVIKVEKPGRGDGSRFMNMSQKFENAAIGGDYYLGLNRNKYSIAIDISKEEGRKIIKDMIPKIDVVVENFRPGTMDKHGLGWEDLRKLNPALIYCGISAFGRSEDDAKEPGMDVVVQARAGTVKITGEPDGPPSKPGVSIADMGGGLQATIGVLLAWVARQKTGRGQFVDVALFDATLMMMANYAAGILNTEANLTRMGTGHPQLCPYQAFETADKEWVFLAAGTNSLWRTLCRVLNREDLLQNPKYARNYDRVVHRKELVPDLQKTISQWNADDLMRALSAEGFPCSKLNDPKEAYLTAREKGRNIVAEVDHPVFGTLLLPGVSINLSDTAAEIWKHPPILGEDSKNVLKDLLNLSETECQALQDNGVIEQPVIG